MHTVQVSRLPWRTPRIVGIVAANASSIAIRAAVTQRGAAPPSVNAAQPPARTWAALPPATGSFFGGLSSAMACDLARSSAVRLVRTGPELYTSLGPPLSAPPDRLGYLLWSGQPRPFAASADSDSVSRSFPRHSWWCRNSSVNASQCELGTIWKLSVAIDLLSPLGTPAFGSVFAGSP